MHGKETPQEPPYVFMGSVIIRQCWVLIVCPGFISDDLVVCPTYLMDIGGLSIPVSFWEGHMTFVLIYNVYIFIYYISI